MGDYPEHEKLAAVKSESQAIGEFMDVNGVSLRKDLTMLPLSETKSVSSRSGEVSQRSRFSGASNRNTNV